MFTGIVEEVGTITTVRFEDTSARLEVACAEVLRGVAVGDSIAVDGCCLTVTDHGSTGFGADLMAETLRTTALGALRAGDPVNLEAAARLESRLGGHLVQGHVDGVGEVVDRHEAPGTVTLTVAPPRDLARYLVPKGSIAVSGVSLTVIDVDAEGTFRVGLVPHTLDATTLRSRAVGDRVNLEVDVVAKYVERLLGAGAGTPYAQEDV